MPLYEIMCIATLQSTPQQLVNMLQRLSVVVQKGKGVFRRVEHLGVRPLAYRMKAHMKYNTVGRYVRFYIQASPVLLNDIETRLRFDDTIVRHMTIKHKLAAPVVVQKRVNNMKSLDSSSVTGILTHSPVLEYHAARALMALGLMRPEDVLALPRYKPDPAWESLRQTELVKRAQGGSAAAAGVLQVPIPTRQEDLALMGELSVKEEAEMEAYEAYRKANNARKAAAREAYEKDEDAATQRRLEWYHSEAKRIKERALAKRLNNGKRPTPEKAAQLIAKGDPRVANRDKARKRQQQRDQEIEAHMLRMRRREQEKAQAEEQE